MTAEGAEVVLVERDLAQAERLAAEMPRVRVVHGDITDIDMLREANVTHMDVVVATTGEDTANVLSLRVCRRGGVVVHYRCDPPISPYCHSSASLGLAPPQPPHRIS
jgi:Trk K+ transport system NAD-binding subunit